MAQVWTDVKLQMDGFEVAGLEECSPFNGVCQRKLAKPALLEAQRSLVEDKGERAISHVMVGVFGRRGNSRRLASDRRESSRIQLELLSRKHREALAARSAVIPTIEIK